MRYKDAKQTAYLDCKSFKVDGCLNRTTVGPIRYAFSLLFHQNDLNWVAYSALMFQR